MPGGCAGHPGWRCRGGLPHRRTDLVRHTASAVGRDDIGASGADTAGPGRGGAVLCPVGAVLQAAEMKEEADLTLRRASMLIVNHGRDAGPAQNERHGAGPAGGLTLANTPY